MRGVSCGIRRNLSSTVGEQVTSAVQTVRVECEALQGIQLPTARRTKWTVLHNRIPFHALSA